MSYWVGVYRAYFRLSWSAMVQYRFAMLIWAVWGFVGPLVSLAVWSAASSSSGKPIAHGGTSFSQADFAAYFLTVMIFQHLTMSFDVFDFAYRVRDGGLSPRLLKPIHPIHNDIAQNIGFKLFTASMLLPVWILLFVLLRPTPPHSWTGLVLAVPALALAALLEYVWMYCLAVIAFWTTRVDAINQLYFTLDAFLAGRIAPLALMPGWLGTIALYLPFRGMGSFPVELALGRLTASAILPGFALQAFWLGVGLLALKALWSAGVKQYSAVGA